MRCWWVLVTPTTLPPTFSSVLPDWAVHPLTQRLHCLHHRSSVLCWFLLAARCSQNGSHRKRAQVKESSRNSTTSESQPCYLPTVWPWKISQTQQVSFLIFSTRTMRVVFTGSLFGFNEFSHTSVIKSSWQKSSGLWGSQSGCPQGGDRTAGLGQWLEGNTGKVLGPWQRYFLFTLGASSKVLSVWELSFAVCWRAFQFLGFVSLESTPMSSSNTLWERWISRKCFDVVQRWTIGKE